MSIRSFALGRHVLQINGAVCGFLRSVAGGGGFAQVAQEPVLQETKKHIGPPRWEDVELRLDLPPAAPVRDWITALWTGKVAPRTVVVSTVDSELHIIRERKFRNALLTGTTISAMDAAARDPGFLTLKVMPEFAETSKASGILTVPKLAAAWQRSYFRLDLPGLDCTRVAGIDSFTVTRPFAEPVDIGAKPVPGSLSFPDLTVTLAESAAATWESWFQTFVVEGRNADTDEKTGSVSLLSPDLTTVLARIGFYHVGIFRLTPDWGGDPALALVSAGLYCERMDLSQVAQP